MILRMIGFLFVLLGQVHVSVAGFNSELFNLDAYFGHNPVTGRFRWKRQAANTTTGTLSIQQTDVSLQLEPDAPWENFLTPAPTIITLLGQLMLVSTTVDFSLNDRPPLGGFKFVRHPTSFRASLVQISNDGWGAFHTAHKNMDKIQLYMQQVPIHVKTALKLIIGSSPAVLKRMLPITLETIRDIGSSCVQLSIDTERKFLDVMLLQAEILEATMSSKNIYDEKLVAVRQEAIELNLRKENLNTLTADLKKHQEKIRADVKKFEDAYDKAIRDIPTGWKAIGQDLVRAAINVVQVASSSMSGGVLGLFRGGRSEKEGAGGGNVPNGQSGNEGTSAIQTSNVLSVAQQLFDQVHTMKKTTEDVLANKLNDKNPNGLFTAFNEVLSSFEETLMQYSNMPIANKAAKLVQRGRKFCTKMIDEVLKTSGKKFSDEEKRVLNNELDDLSENLKPLVAAGAYASSGTSIQSIGGETNVQSSTFTGKHGNERFKAYLNMELLKTAQKRYDDVFAEIRQTNEQMEKLMVRMSNINFQERNYEKILELIREGVKMIGQIREQWSRLVSFFTAVSTRAEVALQQSIIPFVKYMEAAGQIVQEEDKASDREFFKQMFLTQTADIHKIAYFLYTLSSTYVDVSTKYLLDRLAGLSVLLAASTDAERQAAMAKLRLDNTKAQQEIKSLGEQRRLSYKKEVDRRVRDVEDYVNRLGGPHVNDHNQAMKGIEAVNKKNKNPKNPFDIDLGI